MKSPCYNCTKRHLGCHSDCAEYKVYQSGCKTVLDAKYVYYSSEALTSSYLANKKSYMEHRSRRGNI